eukprot:3309169-Pyramimonas_sp.AAC.1
MVSAARRDWTLHQLALRETGADDCLHARGQGGRWPQAAPAARARDTQRLGGRAAVWSFGLHLPDGRGGLGP